MSGTLNDLPGVPHRFDVSAPSQSFVADAESMSGGSFRELMELSGNQFVVVDDAARNIRADKQERSTQPVHQFKLPFSPIEVPSKLFRRNSLEIPEGLKKTDLQSQVVGNTANLGS